MLPVPNPETHMQTFSFVVPTRFDKERAVEWLASDHTSTDVETEALRLTFRAHTTLMDDLSMELRMDELTGGVGATVDLIHGVDKTFDALSAAVRLVWDERSDDAEAEAGDGKDLKPEDPTDDQLNEIITAVVNGTPATPREQNLARLSNVFTRMRVLLDNLRLAALWPIIIVDPAPGWEDFAVIELPDILKATVVNRFKIEREKAMVSLGK